MPINDPITALERQFQLEDAQRSPLTNRVLQLTAAINFWPVNAIAAILTDNIRKDSDERTNLMLETCLSEVQRHEAQLQQIRNNRSEEERKINEQEFAQLFLDGARRAQNTRAKERVKRIGLILANGIVDPKPVDADETEEMMRIAVELSDRDVELLRELYKVEASLVQAQGRIDRYNAHMRWEQAPWRTRVDPELDSVFSKLESYGLVSRIPAGGPPLNSI